MASPQADQRAGIAIGIFAKAPRQGEVKTRLIPALGEARACELHRRLVSHTLAMLQETRQLLAPEPTPAWLFTAGEDDHPFFGECRQRFDVALSPQRGDDLGERLNNAFEQLLQHQHRALIIGCDCLSLTPSAVATAAARLLYYDAVIAPAEDGGYLLLGLTAPCPALFETIPWGSDEVLALTRQRLFAARRRWYELATGWDLDRPEDLARLRDDPTLAPLLRL